jgi:hypothetical protein
MQRFSKYMKNNAQGSAIGRSVSEDLKKQTWVQTERKSHEVWARFTLKKPTASALLHYMCSYMGPQNALVISQSVLSKKMGVSVRTINSALSDLAAHQWIQIVKLGKGKECAYVVNDRVAWDQPRDKLNLSLFSATVVADFEDQVDVDGPPLKRIPVLFSGEQQLPTGPGEPPPSQPSLQGLEPDLPSIEVPDPWAKRRAEITQLEADGYVRNINETTGEITWVPPAKN